MKTVLIKTKKRKNNISKEYLQGDIQKKIFSNELSNITFVKLPEI